MARQVQDPAQVPLVGSLRIDDPEDVVEWQHASRRQIDAATRTRFQGYVREIFGAMGMDLGQPGTARTPERFIAALFDATEGYEGDPKLVTAFPTECRGGPDCTISQIVEGPINYHALCEHHGFPFYGHAYVGYVAHEHIIGISKLTRAVRLFARRFTVQERIGQQIAELLDNVLHAHGIAVYIEGTHLCTQMRGVRDLDAVTQTTYWRGVYETEPQMRLEFAELCRRRAGVHG
jgi:GTP cyclohydrolase I